MSQETLEQLRDEIHRHKTACQHQDGLGCIAWLTDKLNAYTRAVAERERREWISVDERLPEKIPCTDNSSYRSEYVLVFADNDQMMAFYHYERNCWEDYGEFNSRIDCVTHWMPLPEPPAIRNLIPKEGE